MLPIVKQAKIKKGMKRITTVERFNIYQQGRINAVLLEIIYSWLSGSHNEDIGQKLEDYFNDVVTCREPTRRTYIHYRKLQKTLGFPKERKIVIPFSKRLWVRIAAILVPAILTFCIIWLQS